MTLAALLEELKEVDVKTYDDIEVSRRPTEEFAWYDLDTDESIHVSFGEAVGRITRDSPQYQDIVQGCIQRACERRGWGFIICNQVANVCTKTSTYASEIYDTPAEALLAAYIAAIREEDKCYTT